MPNTYVIIGVLILALVGAGGIIKYQIKSLSTMEIELEDTRQEVLDKTATIEQLTKENDKIIAKAHKYQGEVSRLQEEKDKIKSQAIKDLSRVERIAIEKSKLYEKLVNRDYRKSQEELRELTE